MKGRILTWVGGASTIVAASCLASYFVKVGLDKADKLASVLGLFVALVGLVLAIWGVMLARKSVPSTRTSSQSVADGTVHGDVTQIRGVTGSVRIGHSAPRFDPGSHTTPTSAASSQAALPEGQYVIRSDIGGSVHQIDQVGGDAEIER
ncbi:hypothetical protein ACWDA3_60545 [Nonomuraea rubra]